MLVVLLLVADFQSALVTALIFVLIGLMLNTIMQKRAISLGNEAKKSAIYINEAISELFTSLREIRTKNTTKIYEERVKRGRAEIIRIAADQKMMPIFSKYVIEISIFTLFLVIAAIQFTFNDTARAVGNLALFFAASTRMSPAVLRMQQNFIQMKGAIGGGKGTLELLKIEHIKDSNAISNFKSGDFTPSVNFEWVSFSYGEDQDWRLGPLNFQVPPLSFVAFVGGSGAGKSTIIDLIFGLLKPQEGNVTISGRPASVALKTWPGKFGYVPQNVAIHKGTVLSNLLLGMEENEENIQSSLEALQLVGLGETSANPKFGLKTELDERGSNLSGGQRQRLGIARAIVSKPELLILDESTSSLDAISESLITESLDILRGKLTIIVIAHRLSTVKKADILYYVERGKILAEGDFNSLRRKVPDFDLQSKLMGM
jgi:ABC-type multidrug transport system fused ATPase/permease subunit